MQQNAAGALHSTPLPYLTLLICYLLRDPVPESDSFELSVLLAAVPDVAAPLFLFAAELLLTEAEDGRLAVSTLL